VDLFVQKANPHRGSEPLASPITQLHMGMGSMWQIKGPLITMAPCGIIRSSI